MGASESYLLLIVSSIQQHTLSAVCLFLQGWVADMHPPSRQDYVAISFARQGSGSYSNSKQWRRQSCWRKWKQLSRLQRSLILFILVLLFICGIASYPAVTEHIRGLTDGEQDTDSNSILRPVIPHVPPLKQGPPPLPEQPSQVSIYMLLFFEGKHWVLYSMSIYIFG
ncbi:endoplasmic reticulum mannosyl-oligosaccharide 1,2-alpha-mannosidase-like [Micropterus dolomieu]|uniref:endoplasmic reticulum mannosyl-oligosaccharide 1,2-alpha-mannosidase-like n=1 Tax=Micropterus dolomieu TaxID=147949 RepID=UPI001E8E0840|nr:endoplasmic reticulum mannosyl-oligosaccharide 1,2-alpha-mannosidase-like [Micropterus dolomieu]